MKKLLSLLTIFQFMLVLIVLSGCSSDREKEPDLQSNSLKEYNVLVIVSDALRGDVLGCYGGEAETPHIDWLAKNGVRFSQAYSTSPWTVPSAVSMLTGNHPTTYSFSPFVKSIKINVPDSDYLLAENLIEIGYHVNMLIENPHASMHNNMQGFSSLPGISNFSEIFTKEKLNKLSTIINEPVLAEEDYRKTYLVLDHLLKSENEKKKFTLHWIVDPHAPYKPADKFKKQIVFDTNKLPRKADFYAKSLPFGYPATEDEIRYNKKLYVKEVESVDARVGFMIDVLKQTNQLENTFIIFTSDHGEQFGEHGFFGHGGFGNGVNYYQTLLRVPLIFFGPGLGKGITVNTAVSHIGLMPTIRDLLGLTYADEMQGESYKNSLMGLEGTHQKKAIFFSDVRSNSQIDGVLLDKYKLIALSGIEFELYNVIADPKELVNLAEREPERVKELNELLLKFRKENISRKELNQRKKSASRTQTESEKKATINKLKELGYMK